MAMRWAQARAAGGRVGAEAVKVLVGMSQTRVADVPVAARQKTWKIARRRPAPGASAGGGRSWRQKGTERRADPTGCWETKETVLLEALIAQEPEVEGSGSAGGADRAGRPAFRIRRSFSANLDCELKKGSGFPITFPVELANGCVGYVPTRAAFDPETGGGYETRLTSYSNLEITAGDQFRDVGLELARSLKPMALPQVPAAPPARARDGRTEIQPPQVRSKRLPALWRITPALLLASFKAPAQLAPDEALKSFQKRRTTFRSSWWSAEPLVASPCAVAFDERGRMFVAENPRLPEHRSAAAGNDRDAGGHRWRWSHG